MSGFSWDWDFVWSILPDLLTGFRLTIIATILGTISALILGLIWTLIRLAEIPLLSSAVTWIVHFFRGTPFLVQLYFLFYVLPLYGFTMSPLMTGIVGLALYNGAMASEVYRAGIENVQPGQWEASLTLGVPLPWMWTRVILPQAVRSILPMLGNIPVVMFKETSLLSVITVMEVLATAGEAGQMAYRFIEPYTIVAGLYFIVSYIAVLGVRRLERWSAKGG